MWQANHLRLIAFPTAPAFGTQQNWWEELTGGAPEESSEKRQRQEKQASGPFDGIELTLDIDVLRVQWTAQPRLALEDVPDGLPTIGQFLVRRDRFVRLMQQWLETCPPLSRLAFVGALQQPVGGHREAYEILDRYLRHVEVDPETTDFLYRINRRLPSRTEIPALMVNRLSTWAATKHAFTRVVQAAGGEPVPTVRAESFAARVELDINTVPDFPGGVLPHDRLGEIFAELSQHALEVATNGDVRP
jgi:hypothetical protein